MTTLSVPPGCTGVELPNGKKLDANKSGKIHVDDPAVEKYALKSTVGSMGVVSKTTYSFNGNDETTRVCQHCHFTGFTWQTICPRCDKEMTTQEDEE